MPYDGQTFSVAFPAALRLMLLFPALARGTGGTMRRFCLSFLTAALAAVLGFSQSLYDLPAGVKTRWISFENPTGEAGQGGKTNEGRKGAPSRPIKAGEKVRTGRPAGQRHGQVGEFRGASGRLCHGLLVPGPALPGPSPDRSFFRANQGPWAEEIGGGKIDPFGLIKAVSQQLSAILPLPLGRYRFEPL
jgi:hypothetical protein